jgi:glyoxylase-like metal-dependent hydrolase (beta-lactamase superfamily II)
MRGTVFMAKFLFDSKFSHHIPENLRSVNGGETVVIGTRKAKVIHTGGHTHGHSFYHLPDCPENILVNGDAWCINEFTSDFRKVMNALTVSERLKPDNLLGGHDPLHLGSDHSMKDILASRRRLDDIIRPILELSKPGRVVNATYAAHKRIKSLIFIGVARMWAHMTVLSFCELLQILGIGKIGCEHDGKVIINITEDPSILTKYEELFQIASDKTVSPTRILEKIIGSKKD